jgi:hypothetical protein
VIKVAGFELGDFSMEETMKQRRLGKNGPMVAAIGLVCMGMPYAYGQRNDADGNQRCWAEHGRRIGANELLNGDTLVV